MLKKLTSFDLKFIGIILMVIDHLYEMFAFAGVPLWFHMIGRACAPIFLFMAAEGFHYTHSRVHYLRNLLVGYWGMNIIDFVLPRLLPNPTVVLMNNIFGTIFLSVLLMFCADLIKDGYCQKSSKKLWSGIGILAVLIFYSIASLLLFSSQPLIAVGILQLFPSLLMSEGGILLVLLGFFFYLFRNSMSGKIIVLAVVALITTGFNFTSLFSSNFQWMMIFAAIPLLMYNGKLGIRAKWLFYTFYPLHLIVFYIISSLMQQ